MHNTLELNRQDCNVLKGLAIICIALHNYCHLLPNAPHENEYSWTIDNTSAFFNNIPSNTFISFFSFLGHYGVAVFVFMSGYGLVKKYGIGEISDIKGYVVNHYLKLFKLMFPGFVSYYLIFWLLYGDFDGINILRVISQLLLVNNIIPTHISPIIPGPYWYFGFSMQFYLIFLFLSKNSLNKQWLLVLCCILTLFMSKDHHYTTVWLKYNFVGSIIPFILGVSVAKHKIEWLFHKNKCFYIVFAIISFAIILLSELSYYTWIVTSAFIICLCICVFKLLSSSLTKLFSYIGKISHSVFVVHPIIRLLVFHIQNNSVLGWQLCIVIYVGLILGISSLLSYSTTSRLKTIKNDTQI